MFSFRHITLATALCASLTAGCATGRYNGDTAPEQTPAGWQMSESAQRTYNFLLLNEAVRENDDATASAAISRLLELNNSPEIYLAAANYYRLRGEASFARPILQKGIELHPDNLDLTLALVEAYMQENRPDAALAALTDFVHRHKDDYEAQQILAIYLLDAKEYAQAADMLEAVPEDRRSAHSYYYLAKAHIGLSKFEEAEEALHTALKMEPDSAVEAWAELAYLYELQKDYPAAEQTYARILELGDAGPEVWLRLVDLNLKLNHPQKALEYTRQGPDSLAFTLQAGTLFLEEGFYEEAEEILLPVSNRPDSPEEIWFYLGVLSLRGHDDADAAIANFARVPVSNRYYSQALRFRADLLIEQGDYPAAQQLIDEGKRRFPDSPEFWLIEAGAAFEREDFTSAERILREALGNWPGDPQFLFALGSLYDTRGEKQKALEFMEQVILADTDHYRALNYVGYTLAEQGRDLDRALVLIESALKLSPGSAYILDSLAWVHYKLGNNALALKNIRLAVAAEGGDDPTMWEHYGDIAARAGQRKLALEAYSKAIRLGSPEADAIRNKINGLQ